MAESSRIIPLLQKPPCIAIAIRDGIATEAVRDAISMGAQMLEFRIDQFSDTREDAVLRELARFPEIPRLATIRCAEEGGAWQGDECSRAALFHAVIPWTDMIDIELSARQIRGEVIAAAQEQGRVVIGSFHNFSTTPDRKTLDNVLADGKAAGADIVKIACNCRNLSDLRLLTAFLAAHPEDQLIVIGMGEYGMASRVFFPGLGSRISYTFLGEATAPGQLNCESLIRQIRMYYP